MSVLTKHELAALLEVRTTHAQARQILARNKALLALVEAGKDGVVYIGCPHCQAAREKVLPDCNACHNCAYLRAGNDTCGNYSFGGITYNGPSFGVGLGVTLAEVVFPACECEARKFLLGHIEWAEAVLARPDIGNGQTKGADI